VTTTHGTLDETPVVVRISGELVVWSDGRLAFDRLAGRLNRSRRVVVLQAEREPASLIAFDVLHLAGHAVAPRLYTERRAVLEELFASGIARPPLNLCPSTTDEDTARAWLEQRAPRQIEGLVLKPTGSSYRPGRYSYDPNGNLTSIGDSSPGAAIDTYGIAYDGLDQEHKVSESAGGTEKTHTAARRSPPATSTTRWTAPLPRQRTARPPTTPTWAVRPSAGRIGGRPAVQVLPGRRRRLAPVGL
jgi:hypothetical protein